VKYVVLFVAVFLAVALAVPAGLMVARRLDHRSAAPVKVKIVHRHHTRSCPFGSNCWRDPSGYGGTPGDPGY
jgi:hypothetical protein